MPTKSSLNLIFPLDGAHTYFAVSTVHHAFKHVSGRKSNMFANISIYNI